MAGPSGSDQVAESGSTSGFGPGVPPLAENATPEQKDRHWYEHVYQGDKMPQLTWRAVLMGGVLGMLMSASNLYTTLTVGWAFGVAITACVMSYVVWNLFRAFSGGALGKMSILENTCMASCASAAGYSTGSTIATMFGALLLLNKDGDSASIRTWDVQPIWQVAIFTLCTGLMGVFLAIPMKRQLINHERLPFPSGIAAAETLRSLYSESKEAVQKAYALIVGIAIGGAIGLLKTGEGTLAFLDSMFNWFKSNLFNVRLPHLLPHDGFVKINDRQLLGYGFEPSALLIAAGMIVGLRVSLSMLAGSILLYMFAAPQLIAMDDARAATEGYVASIEVVGGGTIYHVYRWGLWGGTALMVTASLMSLALQWKTIVRAFTSVRAGGDGGSQEYRSVEVPFKWMVMGMVPITIVMLIVQVFAFHISWWAGVIAIGMSFVLSLVACRATGETDTTPIGAMGKVMQLLFAGLHPGQIIPNLASAGIAANSASSSADLLTDLKSGYLLGANPRRQFLAQFFGVFFGTVAIVPIWYLMVPTKAKLESFPAPATNQWFKVAEVLTKGIDSLPQSAQIALVVGALVGAVMPVIERFLVPAKARKYFPSAIGFGLAWMVPFANSFSFAIGAVLAWMWSRVSKKGCETFNVPLASGLIAGESLVAAIIAMTATVVGLMSSGAPTP